MAPETTLFDELDGAADAEGLADIEAGRVIRNSTTLFEAAESLKDQRLRGRTAGCAVGELVAALYVIRYRVSGSTVRIVRIKHGRDGPDQSSSPPIARA